MATATTQKRPSFADFNGGKEPEQFIFEDEQCVVFDETSNKQAPVHFLVVPKKTIPSLIETSVVNELILGHLLIVARRIAKDKGIDKTGFRVVMNEGHMLLVTKQIAIERGLDRTGYHVMVDEEHQTKTLRSFHVFGRALHHMLWPVGPGCRL